MQCTVQAVPQLNSFDMPQTVLCRTGKRLLQLTVSSRVLFCALWRRLVWPPQADQETRHSNRNTHS
jgi:hypothetical protein